MLVLSLTSRVLHKFTTNLGAIRQVPLAILLALNIFFLSFLDTRSHYVPLVSLKVTEITLPLPPESPHTLFMAFNFFISYYIKLIFLFMIKQIQFYLWKCIYVCV